MISRRRSRARGTLFVTALAALLGSACSAQQGERSANAERSSEEAGRPANTGRPLFAPAPGSPISPPGGAGNLALGDVNRDGRLDLVVVNDQGIAVLVGQGDGSFRVGSGSPIRKPGPSTEMLPCDLNGDGSLDVVLANHDSYLVSFLLGDGKGGFAHAPRSPVVMKEGQSPHTHGLHAGDLNGDGKPDLVTVNHNDNDVSVAYADGEGGFTRAASPFAVGPSPYPGTLADLNGDGHLDIIATSTARPSRQGAPAGALTVLLGDGEGGFRGGPVPLRTVSPGFATAGDLNGDGKPDLVATHLERRELTVLIGDGKGAFTETTSSPFDLGHAAWHVGVADMNGDGNADVAAAAGDVRVMLGDGQGGFRPAPGSPFATGGESYMLALGDVNGDGKVDVAAGDDKANTVTILLAL